MMHVISIISSGGWDLGHETSQKEFLFHEVGSGHETSVLWACLFMNVCRHGGRTRSDALQKC